MAEYVFFNSSLTAEQIESVLTGVRNLGGLIQSNSDGTFSGKEIGTDVGLPALIGTTEPTTSTAGSVGQFYLDSSSNEVYLCTGINGSSYNWLCITDISVRKPSAEGTAGQILATYGNGSTYWKTDGSEGESTAFEVLVENDDGSTEWKAVKTCGTLDYIELENKPKIDGIELIQDKSLLELGLMAGTNITIVKDSEGHMVISSTGGGGEGTSVQANWNETDKSKADYILNKPTLASVATSGKYADLIGIPTNLEVIGNKVTSISSASTDTEYPSAKCVYSLLGNIESALASI